MIFVQAAGLSISALCFSSTVIPPWDSVRFQTQTLVIAADSLQSQNKQQGASCLFAQNAGRDLSPSENNQRLQDDLGDAGEQDTETVPAAESSQENDPLDEQRQQELEERQQEINDFVDSPASSTEVIILGQPQNYPYVVVIPGGDLERLDHVQLVVPNAFITRSRRGRYIHAASFPDRLPAEALSSQLRYLGFDAQVAYIRNRPSP